MAAPTKANPSTSIRSTPLGVLLFFSVVHWEHEKIRKISLAKRAVHAASCQLIDISAVMDVWTQNFAQHASTCSNCSYWGAGRGLPLLFLQTCPKRKYPQSFAITPSLRKPSLLVSTWCVVLEAIRSFHMEDCIGNKFSLQAHLSWGMQMCCFRFCSLSLQLNQNNAMKKSSL